VSWLTDAEDGSWNSDNDIESPMTLTLTADEPVYENGVLKVNVSWSTGPSVTLIHSATLPSHSVYIIMCRRRKPSICLWAV